MTQVLVFTRTKHGANRLAEQLDKDGISAMAIHGNKSQAARTRALAEFKSGKLQVLVATDIAARGIDIDQLPQVVNFELPNVPEDYVHRIGRTGRAGSTGTALSLVDSEEMGYLKDIEKLIKRNIVRVEVEDFVPTPRPAASPDERPARPPQQRQGQNGPQQGRGQQRGRGEQGRSQQGREQPSREARNQPSGNRQAQGAGKPAKPQPADGQLRPSQPGRKPRPQAALFSAKPGSRGH